MFFILNNIKSDVRLRYTAGWRTYIDTGYPAKLNIWSASTIEIKIHFRVFKLDIRHTLDITIRIMYNWIFEKWINETSLLYIQKVMSNFISDLIDRNGQNFLNKQDFFSEWARVLAVELFPTKPTCYSSNSCPKCTFVAGSFWCIL